MPFTCYSPFASIESKMSCWEVLCEWELSLKYIAHKIHAKLTPWWFPVVTYVFYRNPCNVSRTSWASHTSENGSVESFAYFFKKKKKKPFLKMYIIICEMNLQSRFNAWDRVLGAGALGDPEGWDGEGGGRGDSGWGTYVHLSWVHVNVWQNHYNIVISLQL